jgi:hypothetical protein
METVETTNNIIAVKGSINTPIWILSPKRSIQVNLNSEETGFFSTVPRTIIETTKDKHIPPIEIRELIFGLLLVKKTITTKEIKGKSGIIQLYGNMLENYLKVILQEILF